MEGDKPMAVTAQKRKVQLMEVMGIRLGKMNRNFFELQQKVFLADGKHLVQSSSFRSVSPSSGDNEVKHVQGAGDVVSPGVSANSSPFMSQSLAIIPPEYWLQPETEELAQKVEALTAENMALRSELNQLNEKSDKLRGANATLLDKLKRSEPKKRVREYVVQI